MAILYYKGNEDMLNAINPFYRWWLLDVKLRFTQEKAYNFINQKILKTIPLERMAFGDSVFIPLAKEIWDKHKRLLNNPNTKKIFKINYQGDGLRIWSIYTHPAQIQTPVRVYKIAA